MQAIDEPSAALRLSSRGVEPPIVRELPATTLDRARRSRIAHIVVAESRRSFVVAFESMPELWEVSFDPDAPAIYDGLVHDWRGREAIGIPGFLNPRRTPWADGSVAPIVKLSTPNGAWVLAQLAVASDARCSAVALINLDVRRVVGQWRLEGAADVVAARAAGPAAFVLPVRDDAGRERSVRIELPRGTTSAVVEPGCAR